MHKTRKFFKQRKPVLTLLCFLSLFLLTGCWDRTEVNDLAIITAAGIDQSSDDTLELTVAVFAPKSANSSQQSSMGGGVGPNSGQQEVVRSAEGVTIADAMSKLQQKFPRRLFWGHANAIILGEELAKKDIRSQIDFILRYPEVRENAHIFISKQPAKEVLALNPPLERDISKVLLELSKLKIGMDVTAKDLSEMLLKDSGAAAIPYIEILPPEGGSSDNQTIADITGSAVFKNDKMIGKINTKVSRGIHWLRNEVKLAVVSIKPPKTEGYISLQLLRVHSQLIPKIENGRWKMTLKAVTQDDISQNETTLDTTDPKNIKMLEHLLSREITKRIRAAVDQSQKMNADILNFAGAFHRRYPAIWERNVSQWDEIFPQVDVKIIVDANIKRPGTTTIPSKMNREVGR